MRIHLVRNGCLITALLAIQACSGEVTGGGSGGNNGGSAGAGGSGSGSGNAGMGGTGGSAGAGSGGIGGGGGSAGTGGSGIACDGVLVDAIAQETSLVGSCTTTVRLDYSTMTPLGYAIQCGPYKAVNESDAMARALADAGNQAVGPLISGAAPEDEFVFYKAAGDFGGSSAVSSRNGLTVFGGTTVWSGAGDITYPKTWQDPSGLGFGCSPNINMPAMRAFDLRAGTEYKDADAAAALDVVWHSALPAGLWQSGYVFDAVVLLYPRSVGVFDPSSAEWIVLVNSGWLE